MLEEAVETPGQQKDHRRVNQRVECRLVAERREAALSRKCIIQQVRKLAPHHRVVPHYETPLN
jgi:hypothetical protein